MNDPEERADRMREAIVLVASLIGRRIERAVWFDANPDERWTTHETCELLLDDGRVIRFGSWGYDADGATIGEIDLADSVLMEDRR